MKSIYVEQGKPEGATHIQMNPRQRRMIMHPGGPRPNAFIIKDPENDELLLETLRFTKQEVNQARQVHFPTLKGGLTIGVSIK